MVLRGAGVEEKKRMAGHSQFKNIMHRKGRQDKAKSKLFGKLAREITVAAKLGDGYRCNSCCSGLTGPGANCQGGGGQILHDLTRCNLDFAPRALYNAPASTHFTASSSAHVLRGRRGAEHGRPFPIQEHHAPQGAAG